MHSIAQGLVHWTPLRHLFKSYSLSVVERASDRHVGLDALDPSVSSLVTVDAIVGVNAVELEFDVDSSEGDSFVVRVQTEGDGDAGSQAS